MVLPPDQLLHLGPDPAGASWNHFDLGLGLSSHINYPQSQLKNSPPQGAPWWYSRTNPTSGKDVVVFSAPLGGATTSTNTQYARCELREYERDGTTKMAFDPKSGDHWIEGIYRIYGLAGLDKPEVTVSQAHDGDDDTIMVSTYQGGLRLRYNGSQVAVLDASVADGDEFYLKIRVNNGTPSVYYSSNPDVPSTTPVTTSPSSSGFFSSAASGWYFKTGSYNQTNESTDPDVDPDASIIRVEIRELKHWHSQTPLGGAWPTPATYAAAGTPIVNAGSDDSFSLGSRNFARTGTVTLNGTTLTSQQWSITAGPLGVGSVLSSTAAVNWSPSATGIYTLEYRVVTSGGTFTDTVTVTVTTATVPVDTNTAAGRFGWGTPIALDDMNYSGVPNSSKWSVYDGPGHSGFGIRNPARVAVDGTKMVLTGMSGSADTAGLSHKFEQKYGKWEVRARSQSTGGTGTGAVYRPVALLWPNEDDTGTGTGTGIPVGQTTVFSDDFTSTGFGKYSDLDEAETYSLQNNYNAGTDHTSTLRFEVRDGDEPPVGGERAEVTLGSAYDVHEGDERWYEFDVKFGEPGWSTPYHGDPIKGLVFLQWHSDNQDVSPPLALRVSNQNKMRFTSDIDNQTPIDFYTIRTGVWEKVVLHCKFSNNKSTGFVEAWVNGVNVLPKTQRRTMLDSLNYHKFGIYRDPDNTATHVVTYDNFRISSPPATTPSQSVRTDWPYGAEYDFWELGGPDKTAFNSFLHFPSLDGNDSQRQFTLDGINSNDWHNYAIEWTPNELIGYVDGIEAYRTSGGAIANVRRNIQDAPGPMHLCLQFDPTASTGLQPGRMEIDWINVYPSTPIGGGGGGPAPVPLSYPSFVGTGTPTVTGDGTSTVAVAPPPNVQAGCFQICVIQCATSAESITSVPSNWTLMDDAQITATDGGDSGDTSAVWIYYNTTGDNSSRSWVKSGTRGFHAVRMAWKDFSSLGQHLVRKSAATLTPYATPVTPVNDKALAVTILCSDRLNTPSGPVQVPNGWNQKYNNGPIVNGDEYELIAVADIQVSDRAVAGANVPTGTGLGTSNFTLTTADRCQMFSFIIEGAVSTGISYSGNVALSISPRLLINLFLSPVPAGSILLNIFPQLLARSIQNVSTVLWIIPNLTTTGNTYQRDALIIVPNLTFISQQTSFAGLLLQALAVLRAGALPYRRPVLRTEYQYPPEDHPFRLIAQRILDGEIVEWELPVSEDFEYVEQLSGPVVMSGSFAPEMIQVQELGLDGYAYWLHVEINQQIRASAILLPPQYQENTMSFSAEGVSAVPHFHYYGGVYRQIQVDPFSVVRTLWNYIQSQAQSDLGVVVSNNSSPVRIGEPATTETTTNDDGTTTTREIEAKPYELLWWEASNIGQEIDTLSDQTPFDYVERHQWNADRTDVLHFLDLGYPRLGSVRRELLFNEENILEVVPVQELEDAYASSVLVVGAGDGEDTIRGYAAQPFGDRVRRQIVITDKTITTVERANARALSELAFRRGRTFEASEIVIDAFHPNAPIGSYGVGDDIQVQLEIPWLMQLHTAWYRITSINNKPSSDKIRLGIARSDTLLDTSDVWVQPDDYVPFTPPPPIGAVGWNGNVQLIIIAQLTVVPPIPVPTANVFIVASTAFSASGTVYGASFAFINFYANSALSIGVRSILEAVVQLATTTFLTSGGIATGPNSGTVTLTAPTTISVSAQAPGGAVSLNASATLASTANISTGGGGGFGSSPFGELPFGAGSAGGNTVSLNASAVLTSQSTQSRAAAVSLSVSTTISADGAISGEATVTQLGNTANGASQSTSSANKTVVSKATASVTGTVTAGHARLWVDSGSASVRMCIYSDSSGDPSSLLGLSDALTISNTTEAERDFVFSGAQQAETSVGVDYWIGFTWPDPGTNNILWSRGGTAAQAKQNSLNGAVSFGTPGTALAGPIDAYVDVTSQTGGGGTTGAEVSSASPAMMQSGGSASSLTSAAFNVPAGSLVVVCVHMDAAVNTHSVSNNGAALSWTTIGIQRRATSGTGSAAAFVAACPTARTGLTVTWNSGGTGDHTGVKVYVITGADLVDPIGGKTQGASTSNTLTTTAFSTEKANSLCFVVADEFSTAGTTTAPGLDDFFPYDSSGLIAGGSGYKRFGAAGSNATLSMDAAGTGSADWNWIAFEIRSA